MPTSSNTAAVIQRLDELVQEGSTIPQEDQWNVRSPEMRAWRTSAIAYLQRALGPTDTYTQSFEADTDGTYNGDRDRGVAILATLRRDVDNGYLTNFYLGVAGEDVSDLLDIGDWGLTEGSKEAAAILTGSALELALRRLADANSIDISRAQGIDDINKALLGANVYGRPRMSQIDAWRVLRNHAIHGEHEAYDEGEVRQMLQGVRAFVAEELR